MRFCNISLAVLKRTFFAFLYEFIISQRLATRFVYAEEFVYFSWHQLCFKIWSTFICMLSFYPELLWCRQGRNERGARGAQFPERRITMGAPNHCGGRWM